MTHTQVVPSAAPETLGIPSRQAAHNLAQLILAQEEQHRQPIVSLRDALLRLRLLDEPRLNELAMESPDLLRSRSSELVQRLLLTEDELHRALLVVRELHDVRELLEDERGALVGGEAPRKPDGQDIRVEGVACSGDVIRFPAHRALRQT